jgi:hypothetical protein
VEQIRRAELFVPGGDATSLETSAKEVAQVSQPAVSPTSKSAGRGNIGKPADWEIRDTADLEVCATIRPFAEIPVGIVEPARLQESKMRLHPKWRRKKRVFECRIA